MTRENIVIDDTGGNGKAMIDEDDEQEPDGPFRSGKIWVLSSKCSTCIFRPGNKMHLAEGRVDQMVNDCLATDNIIPCHKTLDGPRSVCRGLYDLHKRDIAPLRMAIAFGVIAFDEPPED